MPVSALGDVTPGSRRTATDPRGDDDGLAWAASHASPGKGAAPIIAFRGDTATRPAMRRITPLNHDLGRRDERGAHDTQWLHGLERGNERHRRSDGCNDAER